MTRKPLPNYYYGSSHANDTAIQIDDNNNANTTVINGSGVNYQDEIRRLAANINNLSIENKSKSIESIIADAGLCKFFINFFSVKKFSEFNYQKFLKRLIFTEVRSNINNY